MAKSTVLNIADIQLDDENAREHSEENIEAIKGSLSQFGSGRSIVVDGDDVVRAGNGTVEAARDAGFSEVLIVEPEPGQIVAVKRADWSEQEAKGYALADNRAAELAKWNVPALQSVIDSIPDVYLDGIGFKKVDLDAILGQFDVGVGGMPDLDGDDPEHTQMSFVLTNDQAKIVAEAISSVVSRELCLPGKKGEALAVVCEAYLESA